MKSEQQIRELIDGLSLCELAPPDMVMLRAMLPNIRAIMGVLGWVLELPEAEEMDEVVSELIAESKSLKQILDAEKK